MFSAKVYMWGTQIGAVVQDDEKSIPVFSYDEKFLSSGIEIAPFTMPLGRTVYSFPDLDYRTFYGLPGALADSLPDKYGTKILERYLSDQGRDISTITPVERLCYMGKRGMGALEYVPETDIKATGNDRVQIDKLVKLASDILTEREELHGTSMEQMISVGTSAGGARAKAVIAWNPEANDIRSGQIDAGAGYEYWIIKFDGVKGNRLENDDGPRYTAIEYAFYLMAKSAGIIMNPCILYREGSRRHFMTKRFDRDENGRKIHMLSLGGMAHYNFNSPGENSYEQVTDLIYGLGMGAKEAEQIFRRMVFNDMAKNYDDHAKNTSFLMDRSGKWSLAPAYDITYAYDKGNFRLNSHQMCINGKREDITESDLINAGYRMNLKKQKCREITEEVREVISRWKTFAEEACVGKENTDVIQNMLNK